MKTLLLLIALSSSSATYAQDKGGNGGEEQYSKQILWLGDRLVEHLKPTHPRESEAIEKVLKAPWSIRPTIRDLYIKNGSRCDPKSDHNQCQDADLVTAYTDFDAEKNVPYTLFNKPLWDKPQLDKLPRKEPSWNKKTPTVCAQKFWLLLHELLILAGIETDRDYHVTHAIIPTLEAAGKLDCTDMPKIVNLDYVSYKEKRGCPSNLISEILEISKEIQNRSMDLKMKRHPEVEDTVPVLIRNSLNALTIRDLARLCLEFIVTQKESTSIRLKSAVDRAKISNEKMFYVGRETLSDVIEMSETMIDEGILTLNQVQSSSRFEKWGLRTLEDINDQKRPLRSFEFEQDHLLQMDQIFRRQQENDHQSTVTDMLFRSIFINEKIHSLRKLAEEYVEGLKPEW